MPSSTSNSKGHVEREIPDKPFAKLFIGSCFVAMALLATLELQARSFGVQPNRDLNMSFWKNYRFRLDEQPTNTTVLLGASRMTFGLDQNTWEESTGSRPYNLGLHGASCLPMLHDYAENTNMAGKVVCTFSGGFTFANELIPFSKRIADAVKNINKNRYSFALRMAELTGNALQSRFAVLNPRLYAPTEFLYDHLRFDKRLNQFAWFHMPFTARRTADNQDIFINDLSDPYILDQWDILHQTVLRYMERFEPRALDDAIQQIQNDSKTIEDRGGEVIFVRFPVTRFVKEWENERFPRKDYWDQIIARTGCRGFHYMDHEATRTLFPPDGSHLMPAEARIFTEALAKFVFEKG